MTAPALLVFLLLCSAQETPPDEREKAVSLYYDGYITAAAQAFDALAKHSPKDPLPLLDAAVAYRDLDEAKKAAERFAKAAALRPEDPDIQAALGWAGLRAGDKAAALRAFSKALERDTSHAQALLGMGRLHLEGGESLVASETLERLLKFHPDFTLGHVFCARAHLDIGEQARAVESYQRALGSDLTFTEARLSMAVLLIRLGKFNEAWRQLSRVLDVSPHNRAIRERMRRLRGSLTQSPHDMTPVRKLKEFLPVRPARPAAAMSVIRVAVGTTARGTPAPKTELAFLCSGAFEILDPDSKRRLFQGPGGKTFIARRTGRRKGYEIVDEAGGRGMKFKRSVVLKPLSATRDSFIIQRLDLSKGTAWQAQGDRQLKGAVELKDYRGAGLYVVNHVPLEDYLYGVVSEEMPSKLPLEALKAQAVLARGHALYAQQVMRLHRKHGYDVCDGQHCQVYSGVGGETPKAREAVDSTRGLVLKHDGKIARAPYSSNCGGHTQDSAEVTGWGSVPYLRGRKDTLRGEVEVKSPWELDQWLKHAPEVFCNVPHYMSPALFRWSRVIGAKDLGERIRRKSRSIGLLRSVRVLKRSRSGHVNKLEFRGTRGRFTLDREHQIRGILGLGSARSTMFTVETEISPDGTPSELMLYGGGWGHGVGLCQLGAAGRADAGQTYERILEHYFPGTERSDLGY
ncbi:MAG: SpoIID/LytB domain-containing protein [Elusimicrobiota bacterium]